jgi:hypothetical protein
LREGKLRRFFYKLLIALLVALGSTASFSRMAMAGATESQIKAVLEGTGYEPLAHFLSKVSSGEGNWGTNTGNGYYGAFQMGPGEIRTYAGVSVSEFLNSPQIQSIAITKYHRSHWHPPAKGQEMWEKLKGGHQACTWGKGGKSTEPGSDCTTVTRSSVAMACQFGCMGWGKSALGNYINLGEKCTPGKGYSRGRDGAGTCAGYFLFLGAGADVSKITDEPVDEHDIARRMPNNEASGEPVPGSPQAESTPADKKVAPLRIRPVNLPHFGNMVWGQRMHTQASKLIVQETYNKMEYKSSAGCILKIKGYFDVLAGILSGTLSLVATAILNALYAVLNMVCKYIVTSINNLLASVCLPIPNLSLSMSLPSLKIQSCDGISLQNLISVKGTTLGGGGSLPSLSLDSAVRRMMKK